MKAWLLLYLVLLMLLEFFCLFVFGGALLILFSTFKTYPAFAQVEE